MDNSSRESVTATASPLPQSAEPSAAWRTIDSAPRDGTPILVWHDLDADPYHAGNGRLTTYGAHAEGFGTQPNGIYVAHWGGEYDDADDGYIGPWWFEFRSEWEHVLAPTHWAPLPPPPADARDSASPRQVES